MNNINQFRSGVVISYLNLGLSTLIPFFYTPVMLRLLGDAEYGLFSLSNSVIGYLSLLSFGIGDTIVRYITLYHAKGEKDKVENTFSFFLIVFSVISFIVMIGGVILSFSVNSIFENGLTDSELSKMRVLMLIMAFNMAVTLPSSVFSSVIISYERYVFRKLLDMFATVAAPLANLVMLYLGYASIGMALASTLLQLIVLPIEIIYCLKVLHVRPRYGRLEKGLIKEMFGFSVFTFLGTIVDMLFWATDKVILGMLTSTVVVAVYNIGVTFNNMVVSLSSAISNMLAPKVTTMIAKDSSKKELTEIFVKIGRLQFIIVSLAVSGFAVFGHEFLLLWAGEAYSDSYYIALLTLIPLCVPLIQNTGYAIVMAQNKHRFRSITYFIIAVANVVSTYILVPYMGAIGAALCSAISYIIGQGIIMNIYYHKVTGINIPLFWMNIVKMAIVPTGLVVLTIVLKNWISFNNWVTFFAGVIIYAALFIMLMWMISLNDYEKDILRKPANKVLELFRRKNTTE